MSACCRPFLLASGRFFFKVRNGLFRLYSEMDPQLARILHNIKIANRARRR